MTQIRKYFYLIFPIFFYQCAELSWYTSSIEKKSEGKLSPGSVCFDNQITILKSEDFWRKDKELNLSEDEKIFLNRKYPKEKMDKIYSLNESYKLKLLKNISTAIYFQDEALRILERKNYSFQKKILTSTKLNFTNDYKLEDFIEVYSLIWKLYSENIEKFHQENSNPYQDRNSSKLFPLPDMEKCRFAPQSFKYISTTGHYENLLVGENCKSYISELKRRNFKMDMYEEIFRSETKYLIPYFQPSDIITNPSNKNCDYNLDIYEVIYPGSKRPSWIAFNNIISLLTFSIYPFNYGDLNQYRFYLILSSTHSKNNLKINFTYAKRSLNSILFVPFTFFKTENKYFWSIPEQERRELYKEAIQYLNNEL